MESSRDIRACRPKRPGSTAAVKLEQFVRTGFIICSFPRCEPRIAILENVQGCLKRGHGGLAAEDEFQACLGFRVQTFILRWVRDSERAIARSPRLFPGQPRACCAMCPVGGLVCLRSSIGLTSEPNDLSHTPTLQSSPKRNPGCSHSLKAQLKHSW